MKVSVIIPTYNEEKFIKGCLESLAKQTYKQSLALRAKQSLALRGKGLEIIVVDDGSTDDTLKAIGNFQFLRQKHKGPGAARNLGAKAVKGEILVFVDADMTFDKNFIKKLIEPIIKGKAKGTFSKEEYVSNWDSIWARCWNINEGWDKKRRQPRNYPDKQKVFRAILKSEFDKVGGFTPGGYTDDYSLSNKLGYAAVVAKGAKFYHKNPDSLTEIFHQARWAAKRPYKLGYFGFFVGLVRASLPVSLALGLYKSLVNFQPEFFVFKIVYDFGIFIGILEYLIFRKEVK